MMVLILEDYIRGDRLRVVHRVLELVTVDLRLIIRWRIIITVIRVSGLRAGLG